MRLRAAASLLAIAMTVAACASDGGPTGPVADPADGSQTVEKPPAGEQEAGGEAVSDAGDDAAAVDGGADEEASPQAAESLWWTAETVVDGSEFVAADLAGEKVVLWMWAPWCSVCNREAPEVADALADLPDDVTLVGVAGRDDVGPMRDFVAEHGLQDMTHVVDDDGSLWSSYGISYQPAWVFVDADGSASVAAGALGYDGIFAGIDEVFGS